MKERKYLNALCVYFWAMTPVLISILTFATYAALGHPLTAAKVCSHSQTSSSACKRWGLGTRLATDKFSIEFVPRHNTRSI